MKEKKENRVNSNKAKKTKFRKKKNDNCFLRDPLSDGNNDAKQKKIVIL